MNTSIKKALSLLLTTALSTIAWPALARDATADILGQPAMSATSYPEGKGPEVRVSAPAPKITPVAVQTPAPTPAQVPDAQPPAAIPQPAETIADIYKRILADAYVSSPALRAEREALRQQYEEVSQAAANWRPTISLEAGASTNYSDTTPGGNHDYTARDIGISASQYLYRGGRTLAEVDQQIKLSKSAQADYDSTVQDTFLNVITAALDIQQGRATIELNEKNQDVLSRELDATKRAFEVGELTRTDVAQNLARLSGAEADVVTARADYSSALARYQRYAGVPGEALDIDFDILPQGIPPTLDEALHIAESENPDVRAARLAEEAAGSAVKVQEGGLLPTVSVSGEAGSAWDPSYSLDDSQSASLGVRASVPIYEGGATRSRIRQAKLDVYEKRDLVQDAIRGVKQDVTAAWNDYKATIAAIDAIQRQVEAAKLARDGVYKEYEVGQRTHLNALNSDAEYLNAQVDLVRAKRNAAVSAFTLLSAMGRLTPASLGIINADYADNYLESAKSNLFGTTVDPVE